MATLVDRSGGAVHPDEGQPSLLVAVLTSRPPWLVPAVPLSGTRIPGPGPGTGHHGRVIVEKSIHLTATGATIEEAVAEAVNRASLTLEGITSFEVERVEGTVEGGRVTYRVRVRLSFAIKEQFHG
jgi:flavin-binding protein dodecin